MKVIGKLAIVTLLILVFTVITAVSVNFNSMNLKGSQFIGFAFASDSIKKP